MEVLDIKKKVLNYFKGFSEELRKNISKKNPFTEKYETLAPDFKEFKYDKGDITYHMGSKVIEKEKLDSFKIFLSFKKYNKNNDDYEEILKNLNKLYEVNIGFLDRLFENLMYSLLDELIEGQSDEKLTEKIQVLFNDLELKPSKCYAKAWIDGIWLSQEELLLKDNIKIRRITPNNLRYVQQLDYYGGVELLHKFMDPTAIIEVSLVPIITKEIKIPINDKFFNLKSSMERELEMELDYISLALRLYKLGSAFIHKIEKKLDSLIQRGTTISGDFQRIKNRVRYGIGEQDIPKLNFIINIIREKRQIIYNISKKPNPFLIAIRRLNNAFLNAESSESSIMFVISSLEAIFLKGGELSELSRRLSQRISIYLKPLGFNPLEINKLVKQAYKIRSIYSHGSKIDFKKEKIENIGEFRIKVMECARISLLIYLQLVGNISKENLLNLIDKSLLDDDSYTEFDKLIKENCKIEIFIPPELN